MPPMQMLATGNKVCLCLCLYYLPVLCLQIHSSVSQGRLVSDAIIFEVRVLFVNLVLTAPPHPVSSLSRLPFKLLMCSSFTISSRIRGVNEALFLMAFPALSSR